MFPRQRLCLKAQTGSNLKAPSTDMGVNEHCIPRTTTLFILSWEYQNYINMDNNYINMDNLKSRQNVDYFFRRVFLVSQSFQPQTSQEPGPT